MNAMPATTAAKLLCCVMGLAGPLLPRLAAAQDQAAALTRGAEPVPLGGALQMVTGLLVVLALIFGAAWVARRYGRFPGVASGQLKLVAGLSVGQRERILIVQAGDTRLLVGVSPGGVRTLHVLGAIPDASDEPQPESYQATFFERFNQEVKKRLGS